MTGHQPTPHHQTPPREVALEILERLLEGGHEAYFAGGCVRDRLMGLEPKDYDIATSARPDDVRAIFRSVRCVGESFGVMLVRRKGVVVEVATFRTDGVYKDGRRPSEVQFSDAQHDATRRDFTINGLFEDPITDRIIDHVDGQADLEAGVIRAIGDPERRFEEDHLRLLRAIRFAARLDFRIDDATAVAIQRRAEDLRGVSRERVGHELRAMLRHPSRVRAVTLTEELSLDAAALDEAHQVADLIHLRTMPVETDAATAMAAWIMDRHALDAGGHRDRIAAWTTALVLSNDEARDLQGILATRAALESWSDLGVAKRKRLAARAGFEAAVTLLAAVDPAAAGAITADVDQLGRAALSPTALISGDDLIKAGLESGPHFKSILDRTYDAQLEGRVATSSEALAWALRLASGG